MSFRARAIACHVAILAAACTSHETSGVCTSDADCGAASLCLCMRKVGCNCTAPFAPAPPQLAAETVASDAIRVSFSGQRKTLGNHLERADADSGPWLFVADVPQGPLAWSSQFEETGLEPGTTYFYRAYGFNEAGNSDWAGPVHATTRAVGGFPAPPSGLVARKSARTAVQLSWEDNADNETGFEVERAESAPDLWTLVGTASASASGFGAFLDTAVTGATTYLYRVRATNDVGPSKWSAIATVTTEPWVPPAAPSGLTANAVSASWIRLYWTDNSWNEDWFEVNRGTSAGGPWTPLPLVGANDPLYDDTGLPAGTTYTYRVRAANEFGPSAWSDVASATTYPP